MKKSRAIVAALLSASLTLGLASSCAVHPASNKAAGTPATLGVEAKTYQAAYPPGVTSAEGFAYAEEGYRNAYEKLMAEDGFMYGMDYDWVVDNMDYAWSMGYNQLVDHAAAYSESKCRVDFYNIKALGFNTVNIWLFQSLGGLKFDTDTGYVNGLDESLQENLVSLLEIARELDLKVIVSIQPHGDFIYGDIVGGLTEQDLRNRYYQFYYNPEARKAYMDNAVRPLCENVLQYYQDTIVVCDLTVENGSTEVDDDETGRYIYQAQGTTWENFAAFVSDMNKTVKAVMPNMMTSSEEMSYDDSAYRYNDLGLDLHGYNDYNNSGSLRDLSEMMSNVPMYVSEVNVTESNEETFSDEYWMQKQLQFFTQAYAQGYVGCFYFSWWVGAGQFVMFTDGSLNYESMRSVAQGFCYQFADMKAAYRGTESTATTPVLLANRGGADVYWLPGRGMTRFLLERSDDGGKTWVAVGENLTDGNGCTMLSNGLYKFTDTNVGAGMSYQYRVTAYNSDGLTTVSAPNNREEFWVATDEMVNGGFEEPIDNLPPFVSHPELEADIGWVSNKPVGVITTEEAHSGNSCLFIDTRNGIGQTGWAKLNQKISVTPGATYEVSCWYKGLKDCGLISLSARTSQDAYINGNFDIKGTTEDDEWHQVSFLVIAPQDGTMVIELWNYDNNQNYGYIDDVTVKEVR